MKKFLLVTFPSHPHSQNYTLSPDSRTVSQGHFQRSNQHFIAVFSKQTLHAAAVSLIWGKLQKLGYHCLYFLSALFRKPDILELKLLECKASALTLSEGVQAAASASRRRVLEFPASPLADLTSHLWKWTDSAQQNLQPAAQKCTKRH